MVAGFPVNVDRKEKAAKEKKIKISFKKKESEIFDLPNANLNVRLDGSFKPGASMVGLPDLNLSTTFATMRTTSKEADKSTKFVGALNKVKKFHAVGVLGDDKKKVGGHSMRSALET